VGGLNHYLLPHPVNGAAASSRFGLPAITSLLAEVRRLGAGPRLTAKVFGGMQSTMRSIHDDLGRANADLAFRILQEEGIPVVARDTGGARGRKLIFRVPSGEAWVKYL
jgi:chemotaxis protein CheD